MAVHNRTMLSSSKVIMVDLRFSDSVLKKMGLYSMFLKMVDSVNKQTPDSIGRTKN
jgi:hypothetical protein